MQHVTNSSALPSSYHRASAMASTGYTNTIMIANNSGWQNRAALAPQSFSGSSYGSLQGISSGPPLSGGSTLSHMAQPYVVTQAPMEPSNAAAVPSAASVAPIQVAAPFSMGSVVLQQQPSPSIAGVAFGTSALQQPTPTSLQQVASNLVAVPVASHQLPLQAIPAAQPPSAAVLSKPVEEKVNPVLLYLRAALRARASKKRTAQSELDRAKVLQYCTKMLNPREAEQFVDVLRQQYPDIMKAELDAAQRRAQTEYVSPDVTMRAPDGGVGYHVSEEFSWGTDPQEVIKRAEEEERERNQQHAKQVAQTLSLIGLQLELDDADIL